MQAVAVGTGSPCLVPTARQRCRHPGAISEIADLSLLSPFLFFSALLFSHSKDTFLKVSPGEICVLFAAKSNRVSIDNINATCDMWTRAISSFLPCLPSSFWPDMIISPIYICIVLANGNILIVN